MKTKKPTPFKYKGNPLKRARSPFRVSWDSEMDTFRNLPTAPLDTGNWDFLGAGSAQAKNQKFDDFYKDISNPYANISTENFAEELGVNKQAAEFAKQQSMQQGANIMQGMQGAAGGSGIAGLAQAMANQGSNQAQQAAASIGQQESANQGLRIQGAQDVQRRRELRASGQGQMQMARAGGATAAQMAAAQSGMQQAQMDTGERMPNFRGIGDRENELAERSWWDSLF